MGYWLVMLIPLVGIAVVIYWFLTTLQGGPSGRWNTKPEKKRKRREKDIIADRIIRKKYTICDPPERRPKSKRIPAGKVLILDKEDAYPIGEPFRLHSDPTYIIRYKHKTPHGCHYIPFRNVAVAGITRPERFDAVLGFFCGENRKIKLEREPSNPYDKNAIIVVGLWDHGEAEKIGYIPRETAKELAPMMDKGEPVAATIHVMFLHRADSSPGLRLHIWA